jgi:hypothetical protein
MRRPKGAKGCDEDAAVHVHLEAALKSAIKDVLEHVVAFPPTFVIVQNARPVGGQVYILLLIGDDEGASTLKAKAESVETTH